MTSKSTSLWWPVGGRSEGNEGNTTQDTPATSPYLLTFEEMLIMIADVEAVLNSCPLLSLDGHHQDGVSLLTAGHIPISKPLKSIPTTITENKSLPLHHRWKLVEHLQQQI